MGYIINSKDDFDDIYYNVDKAIYNDALGKDAYKTADLADELSVFAGTDWSNCNGDDKNKLQRRLAECVARTDANFAPGEFRIKTRTSGLPAGEILHRDENAVYLDLLDKTKVGSVVDRMYTTSMSIAEKTLSANDVARLQERFERTVNDKVLAEFDAKSEAESARERVYAKHNIDSKTKDRELPYYVSEEMSEAGVDLNDEYQ